MTLKRVIAVILRYFAEYGKPAFQHITASARKKETSRSLSYSLMSFLCTAHSHKLRSFRSIFWHAIRFSDPDYWKASSNLEIRRRYHAVTFTFHTWPWTLGCHVIKLCTKYDRNRTILGKVTAVKRFKIWGRTPTLDFTVGKFNSLRVHRAHNTPTFQIWAKSNSSCEVLAIYLKVEK